MKAVIQAGGRGTRLAPYSTVLPKALMPIGDGAVIDGLMAFFEGSGVTTVYITVNRFANLIRSYCGDGSRWGVKIVYVKEDQPLGTMGALSALRAELDDTFMVVNSDVYMDVAGRDFVAYHKSSGTQLTVAVVNQSVTNQYGVLDHVDGRVTAFREKPVQEFSVSTGLYCMEPSILQLIPDGLAFGFDDLMYRMLDQGMPVAVFQHRGTWIDIGRIEDLRRAQEEAAASLPKDVGNDTSGK